MTEPRPTTPGDSQYNAGYNQGYKDGQGVAANPAPAGHPRTYSLVGSPDLFLVTDDESGMTIGYANVIGGPLTKPPLVAKPAPAGLDVGLVVQAVHNVAKRHGVMRDAPPSQSLMSIYGYSTSPADMDGQIAAEYARLAVPGEARDD